MFGGIGGRSALMVDIANAEKKVETGRTHCLILKGDTTMCINDIKD